MRVLEDMREVSSEIENGMREDFARLDEVTQTMFLGRLGASGYRDRDRWRRMLMDGPRQREMPTFWQTKAFLISTEDTALTDEAGTSLRLFQEHNTRIMPYIISAFAMLQGRESVAASKIQLLPGEKILLKG